MIIDKLDVCVPIKDKSKFDAEKMNLHILPINKIILSDAKGLSAARNELMSQVETEWFLFIDDDITITEDWWKAIKNYPQCNDLGAVNGFGFPKSKILQFIRFLLLKIRGDTKQRGFTSNTLIRKEAVGEITLTRIGRLEDLELQEKIRDNGYTWEFCSEAKCVHNKSSWTVLKEAWGDFKILVKERGVVGALKTI